MTLQTTGSCGGSSVSIVLTLSTVTDLSFASIHHTCFDFFGLCTALHRVFGV